MHHANHVWLRISHDHSEPWQKVPIKEQGMSNSPPPALYNSPILLKVAKVQVHCLEISSRAPEIFLVGP